MAEYAFPQRLFDARIDNDLSQRDVGKALGITNGAISRYEKGSNAANTKQLYKLCELLGVSADYLIGRDDTPMLSMQGLTPKQQKALKEMRDTFLDKE